MGSAEPRSFSRGKRGIAGTLVFSIFDRDALIVGLKEHIKNSDFQRPFGDLNMSFTDSDSKPLSIDEWDAQATQNTITNNFDGYIGKQAKEVTEAIAQKATIFYDDEVPPFDITVSFVNEYGQKACLVLYGVEILNEGSSFSIDQVASEKACTFVARKVEYMKPVGRSEDAVTI